MFNNGKIEHAQKRRVSQGNKETKAGTSWFTRRSADTVSDIKVIYFLCEKDVIGSDRSDMAKYV